MPVIITLLRLGALMVSYFGYWEFFRSRCKINVYFVPAFTIAVHFSAMFLPGLLNFLRETSFAIYLIGLFLFAEAFWKDRFKILKPYLNWGYGCFFLAFVLLAVAFRGKLFTWFDNFTHWGVVVKNMLETDSFPTFAQAAVSFTTYPLGSSAVI